MMVSARERLFCWHVSNRAYRSIYEVIVRLSGYALFRARLYKPAKDSVLRRRQAAAVTRKLIMLRAHGLLHKIPHSHHYQLTPKGRGIITALLAACHADVEELTKLAA